MDDYTFGFLQGLQATCILGDAKFDFHMKNAENKNLSAEDQEAALNCAMVIGQLISDIKGTAAQVHRNQLDPKKIAEANKNYWWATKDGIGES